MGVLVAVAVTVLALDIVSKIIVVATLSDRPEIRLLGGFLMLRESRNSGAAFSIGASRPSCSPRSPIGVIVVILRSSRRIRSMPWAVTLGLLLGGATGNLIDRIFRSPGLFRGWVVDWIQLPHWPVFNLADSAIVCGGVLAVLLSARGIRLDGAPQPTAPRPGTPRSAAAASPTGPGRSVPRAAAADDAAWPAPRARARRAGRRAPGRRAGPDVRPVPGPGRRADRRTGRCSSAGARRPSPTGCRPGSGWT